MNDYHKRMQVPEFVYSEYDVGDSITAYTTDHVSYSYYKYGILPDTEYTSNELMKVAGVLLGIGVFLLNCFNTSKNNQFDCFFFANTSFCNIILK